MGVCDKNSYLNGAVAVAATAGSIRSGADFPAANSTTYPAKARKEPLRASEEKTVTPLGESSANKSSLKT